MPKLVRNSKQPLYALSSHYPIAQPAQRKVSEESIFSNSESSSEVGGSLVIPTSRSSFRKISRSNSSLSCLLSCSITTREQGDSLVRTNPLSLCLKRPAPSACLVDLVSDEEVNMDDSTSFSSPVGAMELSDPTCPPPRRDSNDGWGYFVDMVIPDHSFEDEDTASCSQVRLESSSSLKPTKRRRIVQTQAPQELPGFFLTVPTVDDATFHLSSLTF